MSSYDILDIIAFANLTHSAVNVHILSARFCVLLVLQLHHLCLYRPHVRGMRIFCVYDAVHHGFSLFVLSRCVLSLCTLLHCVLSRSLRLHFMLSRCVLWRCVLLSPILCYGLSRCVLLRCVLFSAFPRVVTSLIFSILSCTTFCCTAVVVCTFCRITSVGIPTLFPLLASSNMSGTLISIGTDVTQSIKTDFNIPCSSMVTVLGESSMTLNGPF